MNNIFNNNIEYLVWKAGRNNLKVNGHLYNIKDNSIYEGIFVPPANDNVNVSDYSCEKGLFINTFFFFFYYI